MTHSESTQTDDSGAGTELTRDDIFHVLQCRRRRLVLKYLQEYDGDGAARIDDITARIAALEHDTTTDASQSQQRQRVETSLHHSHLGKMDELGVIDYSQDRGSVAATPLLERFARYLRDEPSLLGDGTTDDAATSDTADAAVDQPWYRRYLSVAAGSLLAVAVLSSGLLSISSAPYIVGILVSLSFALVATSRRLRESSSTFARPLSERPKN